MIIRPEREKDYKEIYNLVKISFKSAEFSDGREHDLVNRLRQGKSYIPDLALVAEDDEKILGYIMFTKAQVGKNEVLALGPLAVHPDHQKQGIGQSLINKGHQIAKTLGYDYSVVLGSENYYPKLGYIPAKTYGIKSPFEVPQENFMAIKLNNQAADLDDLMVYAEEFGIE